MEPKKSAKANLEKSRTVFFEIGLVVALSVVFIAFEWSSQDMAENPYMRDVGQGVEIDVLPVTRPEPPKPQAPVPIVEILELVPDDYDLEDTFLPPDLEVGEDTETPIMVFDNPEPDVEDDLPVFIAEEMPRFNGGTEMDFLNWVSGQVVFPQEAVENQISGRVFLSFVIEKDGSISNVNIVKGVHPVLDTEALRVVGLSPDWEPGRQLGKAVRVQFTIPIYFNLR